MPVPTAVPGFFDSIAQLPKPRVRRVPRVKSPATKGPMFVEMGACMSSNNEEVSRKKHSQAIDKQLEEDSKRLRRECKILLLGTSEPSLPVR